MLNWSKLFDIGRGIALLLLAIATPFVVAGSVLQNHIPSENPIEIEHRFTQLETKVDAIIDDIKEMKYLKWFELLAMSGLMGEAGIRLFRGRK